MSPLLYVLSLLLYILSPLVYGAFLNNFCCCCCTVHIIFAPRISVILKYILYCSYLFSRQYCAYTYIFNLRESLLSMNLYSIQYIYVLSSKPYCGGTTPFDADPDPTFYIDEDMNPNFTKLVKHKKLNSNFLSFHFNSF